MRNKSRTILSSQSVVKDYNNDQFDLYFYGFYDKTILDDNRKIVTIE